VEVTYSKENLCITQITEPKLSNVQSGFLMEHHKLSSKVKAGQKLRCRILDVDYSKKMADLKELPKEGNTTSVKEMKPESK
jgi:predicted RNA-binding protein with RPS1 domain